MKTTQNWITHAPENLTHQVKNGLWVDVLVRIRDNQTGEIRQFHNDQILLNDEEFPSAFTWSDGSFTCDCNRRLFFEQAGNEPEGPERSCGNGRYSVQLSNPVDGEVYYDEFDESED